jgi:diguanylate cyclase
MPASLLVVDLDHFKSINDRYGHASGDDVLKHVARLVKTGVREIDTVGRYGGDEFVVLLPNTDLATARSVAERIISLVRSSVSDGSSPVPYSVSIGVAQLDVGVDSLRDWFSRADRGLYSAKGLGRDQVIAPQQLAPESA